MAVAIVGARSEMSFAEEGGKNGRVWGAAELDFRMYVCGATGKFCPAMTKSEIPPARQIDATLAKDLVLIPEQVLQGTFAKRGKLLPQKLEETSAALSESLLPEFQRRVSFDPEDKTDQYALDFDTYIKWKAVASLLPQESDRMLFQRSVGDRVLRALLPAAEPYDAGSDGDMQYSKIRALPNEDTFFKSFHKSWLVFTNTSQGTAELVSFPSHTAFKQNTEAWQRHWSAR